MTVHAAILNSQRVRASVLDRLGNGVTTAEAIATAEQISVRTVYRHVARLRAEGHRILGGAGFGYLMKRRMST